LEEYISQLVDEILELLKKDEKNIAILYSLLDMDSYNKSFVLKIREKTKKIKNMWNSFIKEYTGIIFLVLWNGLMI